jgi:S-adenosylmethionine:tRNA ribosyltransferase-isomerase
VAVDAAPRIEFRPLPPELRASSPAERRGLRRDEVRLLLVDRDAAAVRHSRFDRIGDELGPGDLLVVNTSRVVPAGVRARRASGEAVQLRPCVRRSGSWDALAVQPGPPFQNVPLTPGERLAIGPATARVLGRRPDIPLLWRLALDTADDLDLILRHGEPIRYSYVPEPVELEAYQPVYATRPGSAESPSAGLPFSWELLGSLRRAGVGLAEIVLHTGLSSYQDDDFDREHHLFEERFEIGPEAAAAVNAARRVIAVGTTVVRALETAADPPHEIRTPPPRFRGDPGDGAGRVHAVSGWTSLVVTPERRPRVADALLTGLHEPDASHFDILRAFAPLPLLHRAYEAAIERRYLWHEFGDTMLIT